MERSTLSESQLDLRIEECPSASPLSRAKLHRPLADKPMSTRRCTSTVKPPGKPSSSPPKTPSNRNVLDEKGRLMLEVLQDYGPYTPRREYSCRSLPKPRQDDFILRHNAQNIHDFKKEYSKRFGTLNRRPPQFHMDSHDVRVSVATHHEPLWKETGDGVWMLTDRGHYTLVQSNSTSVPRATITLPALSQRILGSPFKEKAAVGRHVDLSEDASFAALVRQHLYSPRPVAQHSFAKARIPKYALAQQQLTRRPSTSDGLTLATPSSPKSHSPHTRPYSSDYKDTLHWPHSPVASPKPSPFGHHADASDKTTATFSVVDIEPSIVNFHMVTAKQTYHFPVKVHNVGTKQERFRIRSLTVKSGGVECLQAVVRGPKDNV
ncbi:hypothetical protein, variant [Aphanomyces invadans]|uniref:MSP domain-containing protein n=1 Tax=Aphanomyces invadans TaxID=157072 RepID=A0A024U007_9STRA|nr:hypothetical protein, variant [Aphanomyces invadans]ETV99598.1 hypothetical protein, variant [Aphanomyces invadans]|eukprot:XP_008872154.1 hypothetical protein, variant [Aphanomyces invadans]